MSGPASGDAFLVAKCLEFCQALSSQGQVFNISISTGSGFSFSLDTRSKASPSQSPKKKASPSTLRRNAKRKEEFLARKQQSSPTTDSGGVEAVTEALECDQCEYVGASEKGLKQHMRMKHKNIAPLQSTPEVPRSRDASSLPVRQCEVTDQGPWADDAYLEAGLNECPVCHVKRPNRCDFWVGHPYVPKK